MEDFCEKNNLKFYKIKKDHSPRASLFGFLYAALNIFEEIIQINKNDVNESIKSLYELKKGILVDSLYKKNMAVIS